MVRVKTAKGRKISSTRWLQRQLNDPYVINAKKKGFRSRSAYKLIEIDDKFRLLRKGYRVADLGSVPGGWSQVAAQRVLIENQGYVCALDLQKMLPISGVEFIQCNIIDEFESLVARLQHQQFDVVLSDMAAQSCGHKRVDHAGIIHLCEMALNFARKFLCTGGSIVLKMLQGEHEREFLSELKKNFKIVKYFKPKASRADSSEIYLIGLNYLDSKELIVF